MSDFEARYGGRCGECDGFIRPGDRVHYVDDELCHVLCDSAIAPVLHGLVEVVCSSCFLTACDCGRG